MPLKKVLTQRQTNILTYIKTCLSEQGYPPTIREIAGHFHMASPRGVQRHLATLEAKGYIQRQPGQPRAMELIPHHSTPSALATLPILGQIRAGNFNLAEQETMGHLSLDPSLSPSPDAFILQVQGDSMIEAGIHAGDYAIIRPQRQAQNGEIVAVLLEEEATLKRFYQEKKQIRLEPANPAFKPIKIAAPTTGLRILGKMTGLIRKF